MDDSPADDSPANANSPSQDPAYAFKPTMFAAVRELRLAADALEWRIGFSSGRVRYEDIRRVRLSFRPVTLLNYRFMTEIWSAKGPKLEIASASWKSIVEQARLDAPYRAFVLELHRRLAQAGGGAVLQTGTPVWLYWPGVAVFVSASLGLAALAVRALQIGTMGGALFVGGFLALFLWQAGTFFQRNRPSTYSADAVPDSVLPRG